MHFNAVVSGALLALAATLIAARPTSKGPGIDPVVDFGIWHSIRHPDGDYDIDPVFLADLAEKLTCPEETFQQNLVCIDPRPGPSHALPGEHEFHQWGRPEPFPAATVQRGRFCSKLPNCQKERLYERGWGCPPGMQASGRICVEVPELKGKCPKGTVLNDRICSQRFVVPKKGCPEGTYQADCTCYVSADITARNAKIPAADDRRKYVPIQATDDYNDERLPKIPIHPGDDYIPHEPPRRCPPGTDQTGRLCLDRPHRPEGFPGDHGSNMPPRECPFGTKQQGRFCAPAPKGPINKPDPELKNPPKRPHAFERVEPQA